MGYVSVGGACAGVTCRGCQVVQGAECARGRGRASGGRLYMERGIYQGVRSMHTLGPPPSL